MKIRNLIINLSFPILSLLKKIFKKKPELRVLMFHYITEEQFFKFDKLIFNLRKNFQILTPKDFENIMIGKKKIFKDSILLSFDDGYKSQFTITKQILSKHKIKALFFITLNFINMKSRKDIKKFLKNNLKVDVDFRKNFKHIKNMNKHDVIDLMKKGHKIGAHTINHSDLPNVTLSKQKKEILLFKKYFVKKFKTKRIDHFAFTFGEIKNMDFNSLNTSLKNYRFVHTGIRGNNNKINQKIIFRDNCDLHLSIKEILFFLNGFGDFYYIFKRANLKKILNKIYQNA